MVQFDNPIVGGTTLIREAIQSDNFASTDQGVTGWQINRDGTATFTELTIGSSVYTIDQNGNAVFQNVNAQAITLNGTNLQTILNDLVTNETLAGGAWLPLTYQNGWADLSTTDPKLQIRRLADSRTIHICGSMSVGTFTDGTVVANIPVSTPNLRPANNISFPVWVHYSTAPTGFNVAGLPPRFDVESNGNVRCWNLGQTGGTPNQCIINTIFPLDAITGSSPPPPTQYTTTYQCNGSQCFDTNGNNRAPYNSGYAYQGYYSSTNGNQFSILNFPYSTIQSDLSGATITKVEVYLHNHSWYYNSGGTAIIGYGTATAGSGSYNYSNVSPDWTASSNWALGATQWVTVANGIGTAFQNGTAKAIALGKAPSSSDLTYYGSFYGYGQSGAPQLRITYTK